MTNDDNYTHLENSHPTYNVVDSFLPSDDKALIVRHSVLKGIEISSLLAPPLLLLPSLLHPTRFRLARFFYRQAFATFAIGGGAGYVVGEVRCFNMLPKKIEERARRLRGNDEQGREDELTMVGAGFGAATLPILLGSRVPFASAVLGGLSTGSALGVLTHLEKLHLDGEENVFQGMIQEAREIWRGTDKMMEAKLSAIELDADRFASGGLGRAREEEKWSPRYEGV